MQAGSSSGAISHSATFPIPKDLLTIGAFKHYRPEDQSFCIRPPDRQTILAMFPDATEPALFAVDRGARYANWLRGGVIAEISCHLKRIDRLLHITGCRTL